MKHPFAFAALFALLGGCVHIAEAQTPPRRDTPQSSSTRPTVAATTSSTPGADAGGPRAVRYVVHPSAGRWNATCVGSVGCVAPRSIARCAASVTSRNYADVINARLTLNGQSVSVRGRLSTGFGCTEMGCPDNACCNHCGSDVALTGPSPTSVRQIGLGDHDPAFACSGDDSGMCCGTEIPAGDVIVTGVLRLVPGSGGVWRIDSPQVCTP